jgi:hypothetical protein
LNFRLILRKTFYAGAPAARKLHHSSEGISLGDIRRDPPRLVFGEQFGDGSLLRLFLEYTQFWPKRRPSSE